MTDEAVRYFQQRAPAGDEYWTFQIDTTRPPGEQVFVIHNEEWALTEYEDLDAFRRNTNAFSPGTVHEITAAEAAARHPAGSLNLPAVDDSDDEY